MKSKAITVCIVAAVLVAAGTAHASIRDNPGYVASTGLTLGGPGSEWGGETGFTITAPFQINLEYQAGIDNSDIDAFNAYDPSGNWDLNFTDYDQYVLKIDLTGGLSTWTYPTGTQADSGDLDIQWTLTGWHQTILAGYIDGQRLVVDPTTKYRPFVNDPPVNDVEIFSGLVDTEVVAYTFTGNVNDIGSGSVLGVENVPEPASLIIWGLLGAGAAGLTVVRRRRRGATGTPWSEQDRQAIRGMVDRGRLGR